MKTGENHLISLLPRQNQRRILALADRVTLATSEVLGKAGTRTRHVYFPIDSFVSLISAINGKPALEVGMVGREGLLASHIALGVHTQPLHELVQGSGSAWRIDVRAFRQELSNNAALQKVLNRYVYVLMCQLASSAACVRLHHIQARLARWLLMTHDRAQADRFRVTHEFLAYMLGVRREGITGAAGVIQDQGLIEYRRGQVNVLNREGLEAAACCCYAADNDVYARIMG